MNPELFVILSLKWSRAPEPAFTWWRPNDRGYCWSLDAAGRYTLEQIEALPEYFNNGRSTLAIPLAFADSLATRIVGHDDPPYRGVLRTDGYLAELKKRALQAGGILV